jgi:hypothetical protein
MHIYHIFLAFIFFLIPAVSIKKTYVPLLKTPGFNMNVTKPFLEVL